MTKLVREWCELAPFPTIVIVIAVWILVLIAAFVPLLALLTIALFYDGGPL